MPWRRVVTVMLDPEGGYLDADEGALELLGVETVDDLRTMPPGAFAVLPPDPDEQEAMRRAYAAIQAEGVLAELAFQRTDGECVRVRTAILDQGEIGLRCRRRPGGMLRRLRMAVDGSPRPKWGV